MLSCGGDLNRELKQSKRGGTVLCFQTSTFEISPGANMPDGLPDGGFGYSFFKVTMVEARSNANGVKVDESARARLHC